MESSQNAATPLEYLYVVRAPFTGEVRYVGRTSDPERRERRHRSPNRRGKTAVERWERKLQGAGLSVAFEVVAVVPAAEAAERERELIHRYALEGADLLNVVGKGVRPDESAEVGLEAGQVLSAEELLAYTRAAVADHGCTQADVAKALGVSRASVSQALSAPGKLDSVQAKIITLLTGFEVEKEKTYLYRWERK